MACAQPSPGPPEEKQPETNRPVSYGVEIDFRSGYVERGLLIIDRPVVQPFMWVSGGVASLYVWSNITLGETSDGSRPQILDVELTRAHEWKNLTIEPSIRTVFYRDPLSFYSSRSIEGWLYLSYAVGPFRLFVNQSLDVLAYKGAYFGEAGIRFERRVSPRMEVGSSFNTGWASSTFNDAYLGVKKSALNFTGVESWLNVYLKQHFYIGPHFQFSTTLDRALRAELARPTPFFVGLSIGVQF